MYFCKSNWWNAWISSDVWNVICQNSFINVNLQMRREHEPIKAKVGLGREVLYLRRSARARHLSPLLVSLITNHRTCKLQQRGSHIVGCSVRKVLPRLHRHGVVSTLNSVRLACFNLCFRLNYSNPIVLIYKYKLLELFHEIYSERLHKLMPLNFVQKVEAKEPYPIFIRNLIHS